MSLRQIAKAMGISHQRVAQIQRDLEAETRRSLTRQPSEEFGSARRASWTQRSRRISSNWDSSILNCRSSSVNDRKSPTVIEPSR